VFFGYRQNGGSYGGEATGILSTVPELLADTMVSRNDIVRVREPEDANSQMLIRIDSDGSGYTLEATLSQNGETKTEHAGHLESSADYRGITEFIEGVNRKAEPFMTKIEQKIDIEYLVHEEQVKGAINTIDFRRTLNKPIEMTLDAGGFMQIMKFGSKTVDGNIAPTVYSPLLPVSFQAAWYPSRNNGIVVSFFYDKNNIMSFGHNPNMTNGDTFAESMNDIFLPGIGFSHRSLGRLSATFNLLFNPGFVVIEAVDPIFNYWAVNIHEEEGIRLEEGETETMFYPVLVFDTKISFNITSWIALKTGMSVNLCVKPLFNMDGPNTYYVVGGNTFFFRFAPVGVTVRF
jgi:hypothetical protein